MDKPETIFDAKPNQKEGEFDPDDLRENLEAKTARGGLFAVFGSASRLLIFMVGSWLLTKELVKEDYGLVGMVSGVTGFVGLFANLGISQAAVQASRVTKSQFSTLFWIGTAAGVLIAGINVILTPLIVWFFNEPRLFGINIAFSVFLIVSSLTLQHRAILQRQMRFRELAGAEVFSSIAGTTAAVWSVFNGFGYWSLVILSGATQLSLLVGLWRATRWVPGLPQRGSGVREMFFFGTNVTGFQIINYFARNADNFLLGKFWGADVLGLYTRSYSLMLVPATRFNQPLTGVVVSALSKVREDHKRFRKDYLTYLRLTSLLLAPLIVAVVLTVDIAVPVLLGEEWTEVTMIFYALTPACLMSITNAANGWLYVSYGHVDRQTKWAGIAVPFLILAMILGLPWGAVGVAISVSAYYSAFKLIGIQFAVKGTPLKTGDLLMPIYFPLFAATVPALLAYGVSYFVFPQGNLVAQLACRLLVFVFGFVGILLASEYGRHSVNQSFLMIGALVKKSARANL